jgi:phenylpropionate dioxygenase-like ring-hydroxylating dioxygenase large terminal subunit
MMRCLVLLFCAFAQSLTLTRTRLPTTRNFGRTLITELKTTSTTADKTEGIDAEGEEISTADGGKAAIRPLHQNWWPVTTVGAVSTTRPNPVELLNKKLVLFQSEEGSWKCLDDQCSHRFAPLSEGRIVSDENGKSCLQCAYHGWEFDGQGDCQRAPQVVEAQKVRSVTSYPVQEKAGMLFVWADPKSEEMSKEITLPVFPLLEKMADQKGESYCFMRDLPYGFELLGENLLDLAHLPFSHHGVGGT